MITWSTRILESGGCTEGRRPSPRPPTSFLFIAIVATLLDRVSAQLGITLCACQPTTYTFILNFDQLCSDQNIEGPGIFDTECFINSSDGENITDTRPVAVSSIRILELNQDLLPLVQTPFSGSFVNGTNITYTSILAAPPSSLDPENVPAGFQMVLIGRNAQDQFIGNTWIILYSNECGVFPVLREGQRGGWTVLVRRTKGLYSPSRLMRSLIFAGRIGPTIGRLLPDRAHSTIGSAFVYAIL